jgi:hypothetical protein
MCARNLWTFVKGPSVTSGEPPFRREQSVPDSASRCPRRLRARPAFVPLSVFSAHAFISSMNFNVVLCCRTRAVRLDAEPAARPERRRVVARSSVSSRRSFAVVRGMADRRSLTTAAARPCLGRVSQFATHGRAPRVGARRSVARSDSKNDVASPLGATGMRGGWMILLFDLGAAQVPTRHVRPV